MASHVSILVTGERDWQHRDLVWEAMDEALEQHSWDSCRLFVGDCKTGADRFAVEWFEARFGERAVVANYDPAPDFVEWPGSQDHDAHIRIFFAHWDRYGASAGPKRNRLMVSQFSQDGGATHALAFWSGKRDRSGTLDCMSAVAELGIDINVTTRKR